MRREGNGKAQGEVNPAAIFHRDLAFSGIAFTCTGLTEKSLHGELPPQSLTSFPDPTLYRQMSVWGSGSYKKEGGVFPCNWLWVVLCMCCHCSSASPASSSRAPAHRSASGTLPLQWLHPPGELVGPPLPGYSPSLDESLLFQSLHLKLTEPFVEVLQCSFSTDAFALDGPNNCRNTTKQNARTVQLQHCIKTARNSLPHTFYDLLSGTPWSPFRKRSDLASLVISQIICRS